MPSWHLLMSWGARGAMGELKSPRAAPPAFHHSPVVVRWCGAPTGGRCPVFSATALQDPGLQLAAPPHFPSLVRVRSVRSRLLPGSFPVYSPWLLGLWPERLWLSRAPARLVGRFVFVGSFWGCFAQVAGGGASNACGLFRVFNVMEGHQQKRQHKYITNTYMHIKCI